MPYEILEHTADVGLEATGASLAEAFAEAARGMFSLMLDLDSVEVREQRAVSVSGADLADLLVSWLEELIYLHEAESLVLAQFCVKRISRDGTRLSATVGGEAYDPARHDLSLGVKAATYNNLVVDAGPPARARVYFDV